MTGFQWTQSRVATLPLPSSQTEPAVRPGRHASALRAKLTLRRIFYLARHAAR
jgi:hypothetical protein